MTRPQAQEEYKPMPSLPENLIDKIKDLTDIVEIVSEHVQLEKKGRNYVGLCPFHKGNPGRHRFPALFSGTTPTGKAIPEKLPSFSVNPELQSYKCFSCGAGGPVFKFVQDIAAVSFTDAVYALAQRCDVEMPERPKGAQ